MKLSGEEAARTKLAFKIGTAAALCGTSVLIANTVYDKLSKPGGSALSGHAVAKAVPAIENFGDIIVETGPGRRI